EDLKVAGPYAARTMPTEPIAKDEVAIELPESAIAGPFLDEIRDLYGKLGKGESLPIAPAVVSTQWIGALVGILPDLADARAVLNFDAGAAHVRFSATAKPGGPASKAIGDLLVGDTKPLLDLPSSAIAGVLVRASPARRAEEAAQQADAVARLFG